MQLSVDHPYLQCVRLSYNVGITQKIGESFR